MIHILSGGDTKNKNAYIKEITKNSEIFFVTPSTFEKEILMSYSTNVSLFGGVPAVVLEDILSDSNIDFSIQEMTALKESETIFIFKENKLLAADQKKYKKYGDLKDFEGKKEVPSVKFNVFSITDAYANKDKITAWTLYREGVSSGLEPEAIAGVLFWKIKTMLLNGSRVFSKDDLKHQSSEIVSLYHRAHRGEVDFVVSLEQFILSSLSSR